MKSYSSIPVLLALSLSSPAFADDTSTRAGAKAEVEAETECGFIGKTWNNIKETLGVDDNSEAEHVTQPENDNAYSTGNKEQAEVREEAEERMKQSQEVQKQYQDKARQAIKDGEETVGETVKQGQETEIEAGAEAEAGVSAD